MTLPAKSDDEETIFLEAENATLPTGSCWSIGQWAENYYACTFLDGAILINVVLIGTDRLVYELTCLIYFWCISTQADQPSSPERPSLAHPPSSPLVPTPFNLVVHNASQLYITLGLNYALT